MEVEEVKAKYCRCVSKVGGEKQRAIAICTKSVFGSRGIKRTKELGSCPLSGGGGGSKKSPMLANTFDEFRDEMEEWWMSEKMDGFRLLWDGSRREFLTRSGKVMCTPWDTSKLPSGVVLDGELWAGRGHFDKIASLGFKCSDPSKWTKDIKFHIFDIIVPGESFRDRHARLMKLKPRLPKAHFKIVEQLRVGSEANLRRAFEVVKKHGGEGIILRDPNANYESRRVASMLKMKGIEDAEAVVVRCASGSKMSCEARIVNGKAKDKIVRFKVPTKFAPGTKVTFEYTELTHTGLPRHPRFVRVRPKNS